MTPTEQDKEIREAICNAMHIHPEELQYSLPNSFGKSELEAVMQLITADRKRVALEARIDIANIKLVEIQKVPMDNIETVRKYKSDRTAYINKRIAELKAQQEEV